MRIIYIYILCIYVVSIHPAISSHPQPSQLPLQAHEGRFAGDGSAQARPVLFASNDRGWIARRIERGCFTSPSLESFDRGSRYIGRGMSWMSGGGAEGQLKVLLFNFGALN